MDFPSLVPRLFLPRAEREKGTRLGFSCISLHLSLDYMPVSDKTKSQLGRKVQAAFLQFFIWLHTVTYRYNIRYLHGVTKHEQMAIVCTIT